MLILWPWNWRAGLTDQLKCNANSNVLPILIKLWIWCQHPEWKSIPSMYSLSLVLRMDRLILILATGHGSCPNNIRTIRLCAILYVHMYIYYIGSNSMYVRYTILHRNASAEFIIIIQGSVWVCKTGGRFVFIPQLKWIIINRPHLMDDTIQKNKWHSLYNMMLIKKLFILIIHAAL